MSFPRAFGGNLFYGCPTETFGHDEDTPLLAAGYLHYFSHGQHVALYSFESLLVIAKKFDMNICSNGKSFHLLTPKRINNTLFNVLLKISLIGLPSVIKYMIGSKTKSDSLIGQGFRKNVM